LKVYFSREQVIGLGLFLVALGEYLTGAPSDLSLVVCGKFLTSLGLGTLFSTTFPEMLEQIEKSNHPNLNEDSVESATRDDTRAMLSSFAQLSQLFTISLSPLIAISLSRRYGTGQAIRFFSSLVSFLNFVYLARVV
jgi:hypothetical protein